MAVLVLFGVVFGNMKDTAMADEENTVSKWEKVELSAITASDTIAITMTAADETTVYALPNADTTSAPTAVTVSASGDTLSIIGGSTDYGWHFTGTGEGYYITSLSGSYLYTTAANNGVRVGSTQMVWTLSGNYLSAVDSNGATRYLGVYTTNPDWRAYTNTTNNTKDQTVGFWKLTESSSESAAVETPSAAVSSADQTVTFSCTTDDVTYYYSYEETSGFTALTGTVLTYTEEKIGKTLYYYAAKDSNVSKTSSVVLSAASSDSGNTEEAGEETGANVTTIAAVKGYADSSTTYTVEGTAVYVSGKSVYVQDETGGICLYFSTAPSDISLGSDVRASGTYTTYKGLVELSVTSSDDYSVIGSTSELPSGTVTIAELNEDYSGDKAKQSTRVHLESLTVGTVGTSTVLTDGEGNTITAYGSVSLAALQGAGVSEDAVISLYAVVSDYSGYQLYVAQAADITIVSGASAGEEADAEEEGGTVTGTLAESLSTGDQVVIYYPAGSLALTATASGSKLTGATADAASGLTVTDDMLILTVRKTDEGYYSFENGGLYLTSGSTGSSLSLSEKSDYSLWELESTGTDGSFYIKNVNAKYGSYSQYLEYYSGFTTYSFYSSSASVYTYQFYRTGTVEIAAEYETDSSLVYEIAGWGGIAEYETGVTSIYGDKYAVNDGKDSAAEFSAVVSGANVTAFTSTYYMGGKGLGSGSDDYMQLQLSTAGWGDMELSFRLRASNTGSGEWQLCYSTDGESWMDFTTGSYTCSYTSYADSSSGTAVTLSGEITDGIAKTSIKAGTYINFTFDVPEGAQNAKTLYIRLKPSTTVRADGSASTPGTGGVVRLDSVALSGSPIVDESITGYVKVSPDNSEDQAEGTELTMTSETDGAEIYYRFVDTNGTGTEEWTKYSEDSKPSLPELPATLEIYAVSTGRQDSVTRILTYAAGTVSAVKMSPNGGGVYIAGEEDSIQIVLTTETEGAQIWYSTGETDNSGSEVYQEYTLGEDGSSPITLEKGFGSLTVKAYATLDGYADSAVVTRNFTERSQEKYNIYFGQLHSHTNYSDGAGSITDAYSYALSVHEITDTLDFLAVTDHSNSFDNASSDSVTITDGSSSEEWTEGKAYAEQYSTDGEFIAIFGYEMTWSNGLGHLNTFNTDGFQSRTQSAYTTYSTALQNYYATLKTVPESLSQFNHPGTTFGDFNDFSYYDNEIDELITMIEVGNGEGAIGSSSYFPSYEYYTRALDKGWHVAPTNNQDNHKGLWGDSNTARTVFLADSLTEDGIYDALRNYRAYATEDNDLSIYYQLDGNIMGTILTEEDVDDTVTLSVELSDPTDASIGKVDVIVNGGLVIATQNVSGNEDTVTFEVGADYSYYYIKVTEADGDIAVTAPVWVGDVESAGISSFSTDSALAIQNEALTLNLDLYNNEESDFEVESITFSYLDEDEQGNSAYVIVHTADVSEISGKVGSMDTAVYSFDYTYQGLGQVSFYATVTGTLNGVAKVYTEVLQLSYVSQDMVTNVVVDGSHYNDYVTGYYGGNISNLEEIASDLSIKLTVVEDVNEYYGDDSVLSDCALLIVSAPAKYAGTANAGDYTASLFEDDFIEAVQKYVGEGGSLIVCGLADYSDKKASSSDYHTAAQMNKLLEAVGSSMRLNDDEVYDASNNGGQFYRLYPETFNMDSEWLSGVISADAVADGADYQVYSQYSGCSVDAGDGTWLVKGFETTYSVDSDKDGVGASEVQETDDSYNYDIVTALGNVVFLACEETSYGGTVFAAGGVFCSDFEVDADVDDYDLSYANTNIITNILKAVQVQLEPTDIADVRAAANAGAAGEVYKVCGYVTAGTANSDTSFFDCIYIQDETGGIDIFPYAEEGLEIGTYMEITGYLASYQGDLELKVISYQVLEEEEPVVLAPKELSCADAMDYEKNGGLLIEVEGTVKEGSVYYNSDGTLAQFIVVDEDGGEAKIFIDGYILSGTTGKNSLGAFVTEGAKVSAAGILYMHPEVFEEGETYGTNVPVLRVRDCDEIVLAAEEGNDGGTDNGVAGSGSTGNSSTESGSSGSSTGSSTESVAITETLTVNVTDDWEQVKSALAGSAQGSSVNVALKNSYVVPGSVITSMKGKNVNLVVTMQNGVIWKINGQNVTAAAVKDINLGVKLNTDVIPETLVNAAAGKKDYMEFSLNHDGEFGFTATLQLMVGESYAGKYAKLYYYNESLDQLEYQQSSIVAADGYAEFQFVHASDYLLVFDEVASTSAVITGDVSTAPAAGAGLFLGAGLMLLAVIYRKRRIIL